MNAFSPTASALHRTVAMVCGLIEEREQEGREVSLCEADLRLELLSCLLGSQVRADSANAAAERLRAAELLTDLRWSDDDPGFEHEVRDVLAGRGSWGDTPSYRFPALRARQINQLRTRFRDQPLHSYLEQTSEAGEVRRRLVRDLPGIGPKQASMFLRNVGLSYDVAVLDVHVLRFLRLIDVLPSEDVPVSALNPYERVEGLVRSYADSVGRTVGHLDWAIWITMRAARELRQ